MFNFSALSQAKQKVEVKNESNVNKGDELYQQALQSLSSFYTSSNKSDLKKAAKALIQVIRYNRKHIQAYLWLAYIFCVIDNASMAVRYLKLSKVYFSGSSPDQEKITIRMQELEELIKEKFQFSV